MINFLPRTKEGKRAVIFAAIAVAWGILIPILPFPRDWIEVVHLQILFGGMSRMIILAILSGVGAVYLQKAIFKAKDRSVLVIILGVLFAVIVGFWLLFVIGEIVFPH
jgi:hypothetical protein